MRTTAILTVALTTVMALSAVDTLSLAEAGDARGRGRRNSMPAQPSNVAPSATNFGSVGAKVQPVDATKRTAEQANAVKGGATAKEWGAASPK